MTPARRALVTKIRAEGRAARVAGRHPQTNPYPVSSENRHQWDRGWQEAEWELNYDDDMEEE